MRVIIEIVVPVDDGLHSTEAIDQAILALKDIEKLNIRSIIVEEDRKCFS